MRRILRLAVGPAVITTAFALLSGAASASPGFNYVVQSASGSATWHYESVRGNGLDTVTFSGSRAAPGLLHGAVSYADRNTSGCQAAARVASTRFSGVSFAVHGTDVTVTWNLPLPRSSRCYLGTIGTRRAGARLARVGLLSETVPLSRFTCPGVAFDLTGRASLTTGQTIGWFTFRASLLLKRL